MFKVHLKALETRIRAKVAEVRKIDHWNNQTLGDAAIAMPPSVYFDFGNVRWQQLGAIKQGQCTLVVHCVNKQLKDTHDKASDKGTGRLNRFSWSGKILAALDGFTGKDECGNVVIKRLQLTGSELDTNHDSLTDDVLLFSTTLMLYDKYKSLGEVEIEGLETEYSNPLPNEV